MRAGTAKLATCPGAAVAGVPARPGPHPRGPEAREHPHQVVQQVPRRMIDSTAQLFSSDCNLLALSVVCGSHDSQAQTRRLPVCNMLATPCYVSDRCEVKVIDMGSSCYTSDVLSSYVQSRAYRAPEVILGLPYGQVPHPVHSTVISSGFGKQPTVGRAG